MTQNILHQPHTAFNLRNCQTRTHVRHAADAMLRDIAFVLKMTERVRDAITSPERERRDGRQRGDGRAPAMR